MKKALPTHEDVLISQRNAQQVVGNREIEQAFEDLKGAYLKKWAETAPAEGEQRELLYRGYKTVADVWTILQRKAHSAHVRDLKAEAEAKANG
jgi:hypothetical protein